MSVSDLSRIYTACMRSVLDYAAPVFHYALLKYLLNELLCIQRRALCIICPSMEYHHALSRLGLSTIAEHHDNICKRTFESIVSDSQHKLRKPLLPAFSTRFNLRHPRTYSLLHYKTNRFKNSFLMAFMSSS